MKKVLRPGRSVVALSIAVLAASLLVAAPSAAAVCLDAPAGLLARWPGDGTTAEVAHGRDGTAIGGTSYVAGSVDQAFSFDGSGDTVIVPDDPDWTLGGSDFTLDTWVKFSSLPTSDPVALLAHDSGAGLQPKWIFWWHPAYGLELFVNDPTEIRAVNAPWTPTLDQWYHVGVTRSGTAFTLYVDGSVAATATASFSIPDPNGPLTIGSAESNFWFAGSIDEPEIFQRALSGAEIDAIHDAGSTARCTITQSTLSLTGPGTAYPTQEVTLNGTLGLSGGASVNGRTVAISRTTDGGAPTSLPDVTAAADGAFSFQDAPGAGHVVYRAVFAGATNVSAANAFETIEVGRKTSTVSVTLSASKVKLGGRVTVRAHLVGGSTNRAVTIWAVPYGAPKNLLKVSQVDANGNLSVRHQPNRQTQYFATYAGDVAWEPDTSPHKIVHVVPRWVVTVLGGYATVDGVRLYHFSPRCGSDNEIGCPAARFVLKPSHPRELVSFQGRYCHNGSCVRDRSSFRLNRESKTWVWVYYGDRSIIGWRLDFRLIFKGDEDHLGATSRWIRTRVTA